MVMLFQVLAAVSGIGSLVCFIMVLVKMFQQGKTGLGIACILLVFLCGIGALVAFIYGWINATEWGIKNVMLAWTACILVGILCNVVVFAMAPPMQVTLPNVPR
jgi:hypothetical protein